MAQSHPYDTSSDALLHPARHARFFAGWTPADTADHDLLAAECARLAYADGPAVRSALASMGFETVGLLGDGGSPGFVARESATGLTLLAFRGTAPDQFADLVSDLSTLPIPHPRGGRVHRGFWHAYQPLRARLVALLGARTGPLLITGHSLGGALATLAALDFTLAEVVTFGSPRVGDDAFARSFATTAVRRHVGGCDLVPRLPPEAFDEAHLAALLHSFSEGEALSPLLRTAADFAARHAAQALARPFATISPPIAFGHVAPAIYRDAAGRFHTAPAAGFVAADQAAARRAYPHSPAKSFDAITALLRGLGDAPASASPRRLLRELFALVGSDRVPLRDLADHAPVNYVSALATRAKSG